MDSLPGLEIQQKVILGTLITLLGSWYTFKGLPPTVNTHQLYSPYKHPTVGRLGERISPRNRVSLAQFLSFRGP